MLSPLENDTAVVWPPSGSPGLQVVTVGGQPVPADPRAQFITPGDVYLNTTGTVDVDLEATNMPLDWLVGIRVVLRSGGGYTVTANYVDGDSITSSWRATLSALPTSDFAAIQARASKP
jgi:hypothetical protein